MTVTLVSARSRLATLLIGAEKERHDQCTGRSHHSISSSHPRSTSVETAQFTQLACGGQRQWRRWIFARTLPVCNPVHKKPELTNGRVAKFSNPARCTRNW